MAFTVKDWRDTPDADGLSSTNPVKAAALEDLETRLSDYSALVGHPCVTGILSAGHSVIEGSGDTGGSQAANRMTARLALLLGATETNIGKGSMPLFADNSTNSTTGVPAAVTWGTSGGWVSLFKQIVWSTQARAGLPMSPVQVAVFMQSLADMAVAGPTYFTAFHRPMLRAAINVMRCGAVYEEDHATVVHSGGSSSAATNYSRGGTLRAFTAPGTTTISVPAAYPGSLPIDVGGVYVNGATNVKVEVTVNSVRKTSLDLDINALPTPPQGNNPEWSPWQIRIPVSELNAGANTIVLTYVNSGGSFDAAFFDYWQVEAIEPPIILLPEHYYWAPGSYANYWGTATPMTDATVDAVNTLVESVAAEYSDGRVVYVPGINDAINPPGGTARLQSDGVHPNALGAAAAAAVLYEALPTLTPALLASTGTT